MLSFVFAALVVLLDQFFKRWILLTVGLNENMELIPGIIGLTNVRNTGAAFSILADQRLLLTAIAILAALLLIGVLLRYNEGFWGTLGLSAVLGGTIGNLVDRISYGYVVDMFDLKFMNFAVFNIADIFITLGGITFLVYFITSTLRPETSEEGVYEEAAAQGYADDYAQADNQIGLYDFQYGDEYYNSEKRKYGGESRKNLDNEQENDMSHELPLIHAEPDEFDYDAYEPPEEIGSALEALSELEIELQKADMMVDYDLDDLLREYGFEDDND